MEGSIRIGECGQCNVAFCWDCGLEAHSPASCVVCWIKIEISFLDSFANFQALREWKRLGEREKDALGWLLKNNVDATTLKWIQENTKDCPHCGTRSVA